MNLRVTICSYLSGIPINKRKIYFRIKGVIRSPNVPKHCNNAPYQHYDSVKCHNRQTLPHQ